MTRPSIFASGAVLVLAVSTASGQDRTHDITLDDYFTQVYIAEMRASPDGESIAYVEGRWDEGLDRRNMDLWVVSTRTKQVRRLTFDPAGDTSPRWDASGQWIYFLSSRERVGEESPPYDGSRQVWRVGMNGGEPKPVTRVEDGVQQFDLAADGRTLFYAAGKKHVEPDQWKSLREDFDDLEYGHGVVTFSTIWRLDLETWREEKLIDEDRVIGAFAVSPDGNRLAMITTPTEELITNEGWSHVDVYDHATQRVTRLEDGLFRDAAPSPYGWIVSPVWSSDSAKLAFRVDFDGYPGEMFVAHFDAGSPPPVTGLVRPGEVSVEGAMGWQPMTHNLCFIAEDHARARLYSIEGITPAGLGVSRTLTPGDDIVLEGFDFTEDGSTLAVLKSGLTHTTDIFIVENAQPPDYERITNLNPQVDTWKLPRIEIVRWTSPDGTPVEGILELPPDYDGNGPLPTIVSIHGGPTASSKYAFRYWIYGRTLFASQGWAVFDPNYRGSTGYGDRFLTDLIENKNNLDVQDILAGVDMLVERGISDPERLAVMGWSNGGYLTNCLITADKRFKAASSGAGVFDTVMQWSIEDTPGHVVNYSGGLPWERADKMHETSPLYNVDEVVTPTLVHVGELDERVPVEHSRSLHRALHHYLDVPCELVIYPKTGHGLSKWSHRKAKMTWDHGWFDHHVLGLSAAEEDD